MAAPNEWNKCKPFLLKTNGWNIWLHCNITKGWLWLENNKYIGKDFNFTTLSHLVPYYFSLLFQLDDAKYIYYMFVPHLFFKIYWYWNVYVSFQFGWLSFSFLAFLGVCTTYLTTTAVFYYSLEPSGYRFLESWIDLTT